MQYYETQPISAQEVLEKANELIKTHKDYIPGMQATSVVEKDGVLIFKGECFLDENGLPTLQSTHAFNVLKHATLELSRLYHLEK